jgi:hypothetical protein
MTDKVILYTKADGTIAICILAPNDRRWVPTNGGPAVPESEADWFARVIAKSIPASATDVHVINRADLPADRTFRDAWRHRGGKLHVDMDHARAIHRKNLHKRAQRDKRSADQKAARDAISHPDIDAATTPEQLKALTIPRTSR